MKCRCDIALAGYEWMKKRVEKNSGTGVLWFRFFLEHHRNGAAEEADKRCPKETTPLKTKQKTKQTQWKKKTRSPVQRLERTAWEGARSAFLLMVAPVVILFRFHVPASRTEFLSFRKSGDVPRLSNDADPSVRLLASNPPLPSPIIRSTALQQNLVSIYHFFPYWNFY